MKLEEKKSLEERKKDSEKIMSKYIDYIPIIVNKYSKNDIDIDKNKFLVPKDFTFGQFVYIIRKRILLSSDKSLFITVNNTYPSTSEYIQTIYENNRDEDGFLYCVYCSENTFG